MQQWYQCPRCGAQVAFGVGFCNNCGTRLNWPTQQQPLPQYQQPYQQPPPYQQQYQPPLPQQYQQQAPPSYQQQAEPSKKKTNVWLIGCLGLIVLAVIIGGIVLATGTSSPETSYTPPASTPSTTPPATPPVTIKVTAGDLYSEYEANQVAADTKYKDKVIQVTGIVDSIGKDILDTAYVVLTDGSEYTWGVQCMFDEQYEAELAQLSKGQTITIQGRVDGYLINVLLEESILIH